MIKNLRYLLVLMACLPVALFAKADAGPLATTVTQDKALVAVSRDGEEGGESGDDLRLDRDQSLVQDTSSYGGRRRKIKEVAPARNQPKPQRIGDRPPPDPEMGGGNSNPNGNPSNRPDGMNGSMRGGYGPAGNGRMPGQGGLPGGGGQIGGRPAPPPGRGR